jgi:hypothetical protein
LEEAWVAVLLVSPYFLKSPFIMDVELPRILKHGKIEGWKWFGCWCLIAPMR